MTPNVDQEQVTHHCRECERLAGELERARAVLKQALDAIKSLPDDALGEVISPGGRYSWFIKHELLHNLDTTPSEEESDASYD